VDLLRNRYSFLSSWASSVKNRDVPCIFFLDLHIGCSYIIPNPKIKLRIDTFALASQLGMTRRPGHVMEVVWTFLIFLTFVAPLSHVSSGLSDEQST
jgi:hypothetical protein